MPKIRNNCRQLTINGKLWQYNWGNTFIVIYDPNDKRHNVAISSMYRAIYGHESYEERLANERAWKERHASYGYDRNVLPGDFGMTGPWLENGPAVVKAYIVKTFSAKG